MLSSSLDTLLKLSKTTSSNKLFDYDCGTLYHAIQFCFITEYEDDFQARFVVLYLCIYLYHRKSTCLFLYDLYDPSNMYFGEEKSIFRKEIIFHENPTPIL